MLSAKSAFPSNTTMPERGQGSGLYAMMAPEAAFTLSAIALRLAAVMASVIRAQTMASHALVFYLLDRLRTTSWSRLLLAHGPPPCYDYGWQSDNESAEGVIMRHSKRSVAMAVVLGAVVLVQFVPAMADEPVHQKACGLDRTIKITMKYLLYLPKDYDQKASWPLMLFLHGSGERGDDLNAVAYNDPQLYEWLLQQKRTPRTPEAPKK
jgi:hypothetical protein